MSKQRLNELICQREALEIEADAIAQHLKSPGPNGEPPAGLKDSLVDSEGYPRGDIDLFEVRAKRNRLAIINTDYRTLMKEIEAEVKNLHASLLNTEEKDSDASQSAKVPDSQVDLVQLDDIHQSEVREPVRTRVNTIMIPIAIIDEILAESPAATCGLMDGDELLSIGSIDYKISNPMSVIPKLVYDNANSPIPLVVRRGGDVLELELTPRQWSGRGLLGCHLSPV